MLNKARAIPLLAPVGKDLAMPEHDTRLKITIIERNTIYFVKFVIFISINLYFIKIP